MERNNIVISKRKNSTSTPKSESKTKHSLGSTFLTWWYRHFAPSEPLATANFAQREKIRHGRIASLTVLVLMLFTLTLLPQTIMDKNIGQVIGLLVGLGIHTLILILNRKGFVESAGILTLIVVYVGGTITMLNYPGQLTIENLLILCFTIVPYMVVIAFFSSSKLLPVFCISAIQTWAIVVYGPHDAVITHLLQVASFDIFSRLYTLQLLTAVILYVWGRSTELALARADQAEETVTLEIYEKERQNDELEKKRRLDAGIQQILQTHVAVANGDLSARAPLHQDNELWQVAGSLNNLIARLQSQNNTERELRQQIREDNQRATGHYPVPKQK